MLWLALTVCGAGLLCGHLLFRRMTGITSYASNIPAPSISIVIPARNEAANLPRLLASLQEEIELAAEIIVVDDESTDATAAVAESFGAFVLRSGPLPLGWTGKCWACWQGAMASTSELLLFLDADTWFVAGGLRSLLADAGDVRGRTAFSVLPYHATNRPYEQLSLFFNLLMAAGAGGFSGLDRPKLFGQSLLISKELYLKADGHRAVRGQALENLHFAANVARAGGGVQTAIGQGTLEMRMFPEGFREMRQGWERGSAAGAATTSGTTMMLTILWLTGAMTAIVAAVIVPGSSRLLAVALYVLFAIQIQRIARRIGTFHWTAAWAYPVPLMFYFAVHGSSEWKRRLRMKVAWKGRQL